MAVATDRELVIVIGGFGRGLGPETLDLYLETKSVIVSTGTRPINPFGL